LARYFLLGFLLLPIVEIALFIKVGQSIGLLATLALVIGAALLGASLLRLQGLAVISQMRGNLAAGQIPGRAIADAMMIGVAAVLLILPGFLSDAVAFLLLLPPFRGWLYARMASRVSVVSTTGYPANDPFGPRIDAPTTIDLDDDDYRPQP
jgi:UPF0716 protein FxsA